MSKYVVTTAFKDKFTEDHYAVGSDYESEDAERVTFLQEEGFLGDKIQDEPKKTEEVHSEPEEKPKGKKAKQKSPSEE
jgi:hypothetical protein